MADTSKDELDLLGEDDVEAFCGSQADLEDAAEDLLYPPERFGMVNQPIRNHGLGIFWCGQI